MFKTFILFCFLWLLTGCLDLKPTEKRQSLSTIIQPGILAEFPPGITGVVGECRGKIALTPQTDSRPWAPGSYLLVYHCDKKRFEVLATNGGSSKFIDFGDLTLTKEGYYFSEIRGNGSTQRRAYVFMGGDGTELKRLERENLNIHDLIHSDGKFTYMTLRADNQNRACFDSTPLAELEITEENESGQILWHWSSAKKFHVGWNVGDKNRFLQRLRGCYGDIEPENYIVANSIRTINQQGDILVSARELDSIFIIDRKSGDIRWSLGGAKSKMTPNRLMGDPRNGFSHQHSVFLKDETVYLFDNGNNYPYRASRLLAFRIDPFKPDKATFKFEINEPNGLRRPTLGNVEVGPNGQFIIGWGGLEEKDRAGVQRGVSIYDARTRKEVFFINFSPGWYSYRAKHFSE